MGKWNALSNYLARAERPRVVLSYQQIEEILGSKLPESVDKYRPQFWANALKNPTADSWMRLGYRTRLSGLAKNQVAFEREESPSRPAPSPGAAPSTEPPAPFKIDRPVPGAESTLVLLGCVQSVQAPAGAGPLYLGTLPQAPGVCRGGSRGRS